MQRILAFLLLLQSAFAAVIYQQSPQRDEYFTIQGEWKSVHLAFPPDKTQPILVFRNGVKQRDQRDYYGSSTDPQRLTLRAAVAGDSIEVLYWRPPTAVTVPDPPPPVAVAAWRVINTKCVRCHGADLVSDDVSRVGNLNLTTKAQMLAGGNRGPAIVPGDSSQSLVYLFAARPQYPNLTPQQADALTTYEHDELGMPPFMPMSPVEIAALKDWIDAGAP